MAKRRAKAAPKQAKSGAPNGDDASHDAGECICWDAGDQSLRRRPAFTEIQANQGPVAPFRASWARFVLSGDIRHDLSYEVSPGVIYQRAAISVAGYRGYRQSRAGTNTTWLKVLSSDSRTEASASSKPHPATTSSSTCPMWKVCASKSCAKDSGSHLTKAKVPRDPALKTSAHSRAFDVKRSADTM